MRGERVQRYWFRVLHTFLLVAEATIEVAETRTYFMNLSGKVWRSIDFPSKKCQSIWRNLFHKWKKCILLRLRPLNPWPVSWNSCQLTKVSNIWTFLRLGRIVESMWGDENGTSRDWEGMTCFAQFTIYLNWSYLILTINSVCICKDCNDCSAPQMNRIFVSYQCLVQDVCLQKQSWRVASFSLLSCVGHWNPYAYHDHQQVRIQLIVFFLAILTMHGTKITVCWVPCLGTHKTVFMKPTRSWLQYCKPQTFIYEVTNLGCMKIVDHCIILFLEQDGRCESDPNWSLILGSIKDNMLDESSAMMLECGLQTHPAIEPCRFDSFASLKGCRSSFCGG